MGATQTTSAIKSAPFCTAPLFWSIPSYCSWFISKLYALHCTWAFQVFAWWIAGPEISKHSPAAGGDMECGQLNEAEIIRRHTNLPGTWNCAICRSGIGIQHLSLGLWSNCQVFYFVTKINRIKPSDLTFWSSAAHTQGKLNTFRTMGLSLLWYIPTRSPFGQYELKIKPCTPLLQPAIVKELSTILKETSPG